MIRLENVTRTFKGFTALDRVSLEIKEGEVYGFLGHNGAGKTTTLKIITGQLRQDSGTVFVQNGSVRMGYMPEAPSFYPTLSFNEYLRFVASQCRAEVTPERIEMLVERVGLKPFARRRISQFSRGMKQRAALAVALLDDPQVLLLDEPISALDPEGRSEVMRIIAGLKEEGKTILISTHILSDVESICDRIGILKSGQMILEEDLSTLRQNYVFPIVDVDLAEEDQLFDPADFSFVERVTQDGNRYSFHLKDMERGKRELLRCLAERPVNLVSLSQRQSSLEEIYLAITKGEVGA